MKITISRWAVKPKNNSEHNFDTRLELLKFECF